MDQEAFFNNKVASSDLSHYYLLYKGEYAYNKSYSSGYPWGTVKRLNQYDKGVVSTLYICFRPLDTVDSDFIGHYFESSKWHKGVSEIAVEGARNHGLLNIGVKDFFSTTHFVPSLDEQKKIAKVLSLIDDRIVTQNKIIEDLKKLKSAIYDKVFHSLKGERSSLGDVADIIKGKQINGEFLTEVGDYYVMNGGVEPSGYYHNFNVSHNTISISEGGNSCGYIQWNSAPFWSGGHCYTLRIKNSAIENKYLYHFLKWHENDIMRLRIGSGLPNIQKKDLANVTILIPKTSVQNQIIHLMDSIDEKIEIESKVSLVFFRQRTYLLSQMFI